MDRVGCYYITPFKVHQGVTQGGPLPPTIFNVVVDTVICHWVMLVAGEEAGLGGFGLAVQWLAAFIYTDDGLLALPRPARLQAALDFLTVLLDRVGLQNNSKKRLGLCVIPATLSTVTRRRRIRGG